MQPHILIARDEGVLTITLNRPQARNALTAAMIGALESELTIAVDQPTDRIIILRGAGDHFCAGADLAESAAARADHTQAALHAANQRFGQLCAQIATHPKPIIACVQGSLIGGGIGLACAADIVFATAETRLRMSEVTLGLVPAQILPVVIARVGLMHAKRLAITAQSLTADTAQTLGLIDTVCENAAALHIALAQTIAMLRTAAPSAITATKSLAYDCLTLAPARYIERAADQFVAAARSPEAEEGIAAFLARRPPRWSGSAA
jgi:isohexenylglutaconyl-CoA hydratase